jgi:predicted kinase
VLASGDSTFLLQTVAPGASCQDICRPPNSTVGEHLLALGAMLEILVVTGSCGVGKTTICRAWASARGGAVIHGDQIRNWIQPDPLRSALRFQEKLVTDVAITAVRNLLSQGLGVALDEVWFPQAMERLRAAFASNCPTVFVWLWSELPENRRRDGLRGDDSMGQRVDTLAEELEGVTWPSYVHRLDTTRLTCEETLAAISQLPQLT